MTVPASVLVIALMQNFFALRRATSSLRNTTGNAGGSVLNSAEDGNTGDGGSGGGSGGGSDRLERWVERVYAAMTSDRYQFFKAFCQVGDKEEMRHSDTVPGRHCKVNKYDTALRCYVV